MKTFVLYSILLAVSGSPAEVKLGWDYPEEDQSLITGYKIYWGSSSKNYTNHVTIVGGTNLTGTVSGLLPGTTYYFAATAFSGDLESEFSNEVNYAPPLKAPTGFRIESLTITFQPSK